MQFQYFSDIHIEWCNDQRVDEIIQAVKPQAPYLIMAGDIGDPFKPSYLKFISAMSKLFQKVFLITGNHEYYQKKRKPNQPGGITWIEVVDRHIEKLVQTLPNVIFLNNSSYPFNEELVIFGGTMWTIPDEAEIDLIFETVNDFRMIPGFNVRSLPYFHTQFTEKLAEILDTQRQVIVVSHHIPSFGLIDLAYKDCGVNSAFACDVALRENPKIITWVYGHTHKGNIFEKFLCNPIGYPGENLKVNFSETFALDHHP